MYRNRRHLLHCHLRSSYILQEQVLLQRSAMPPLSDVQG
jgi:hypothetical protein